METLLIVIRTFQRRRPFHIYDRAIVEMTILQTIIEYARHLAETFGSRLAVAECQTSCTYLIVNTSTGDASILNTLDDDYQPNGPIYISVTKTRRQSASGSCDACAEDDEFAEWAEDAEHWDVNALVDEIVDKLVEAGVTDTSVASWGLQV